jgi:hypothetical protein
MRRYALRPDGQPQLASVDYDAAGHGAYFDPILHWTAPWTDRPIYDSAGTVIGWDRSRTTGDSAVVLLDQSGYTIDRTTPRMPLLIEAAQ